MRPPDRRILTRVPARRERLARFLWWMVILAGMMLCLVSQDRGWMPLAVVGLVITIGGFFGMSRDHVNRWRFQPALDDARADEIMAGRRDAFLVRRRLVFGLPLIFTIFCIPFFFIATQSGWTPAPVIIGYGLFAVCVAWWYLAIRLHTPYLRLSNAGMEINGTLIPWRAIATLRADNSWVPGSHSRDHGRILVVLYDPLSDDDFPRGSFGRFYRGDNHRELFLSLSRTRETPAVIYQVAQDFWLRARAAAAATTQAAKTRVPLPERDRNQIAAHTTRVADVDHLLTVAARLSSRVDRPRTDYQLKAWHLLACFPIFVVFWLGLNSGFHRSPAWSGTAMLITLLLAAIPSFLAVRRMLRRGPDPISPRHAGIFRLLVLFLMMDIFVSLALFFPLANPLPDWYTGKMGVPFTEHGIAFSKHYYSGTRDCTYQVRGPYFAQGTARGHYCAGPNEFAALPAEGRVRVYGRSSWFGRSLVHVVAEPVEGATAP